MRLPTVRRPLVTAAILIAFGLAAPLRALETLPTLPAQQNAAPKAETSAPTTAPGDENRKTSATNDQSGPSNAAASSDQNKQGDNATHSTAGRAGTEEPGSHAPSQDTAVLVNGNWNVGGAPADSQTVPAKFSKRNDAIDRVPIMAMPVLALSDDQKKAIVASVKSANSPVQTTNAKPAEELPWTITVHDLGISANDPALARMKIVRAEDRILLIDAPNRIVIGEIKN